MFLKLRLFLNKISLLLNNRMFFLSLILLNFIFVGINIYKQFFSVGLIILIIDLLCLLFFDKKHSFYEIFLLYPLARVLKLPGISTSFLTIAIAVLCITFILKFFIAKRKPNQTDLIVFFIFVVYVVFTLTISLINQNFALNNLFSYYLYLFLPILTFICVKKENDIDCVNGIIISSIAYFYGFLLTIIFYNLIPGGSEMLKAIGVNLFSDVSDFVRYSPLTDDPNYGTMFIILLSCLFIIVEKTNRQIKIGYPIIIMSLFISFLSISKLYIICASIIFVCLIISFVKKTKNSLIRLTIVFACSLSVTLVLCLTPFGQYIIERFLGSKSSDFSIFTITTGRSELFGLYSSYILSNPLVLLFGKGPLFFSKDLFYAGNHDTFVRNIFGSGLIGVTLMLLLLFIMLRHRFDKMKIFSKNTFFYGFVLCLLICCFTLSLAPSTVFPIFVISAQFTHFKRYDSFVLNKKDREKYV